MRITDFHRTKRGRIALYVDGEFLLSMHPDVFAASGLNVGAEVDADALAALAAEADLKKAKEKALSLLSSQAYTSGQLRQRLERLVDGETASQAVERMEELGLVDDGEYARRYARELYERKRFGPLRIRQELRRRGLPDALAGEALEELDTDPQQAMREVLERKYPLAAGDEAVKRRAYGALLRLGYRPAEVRRALAAFCGGGDWDD